MGSKKSEVHHSLSGDKELDKIVLEPFTHVMLPNAKEAYEDRTLRAFNYWLKVPDEKEQTIMVISDILIFNTLELQIFSHGNVNRRLDDIQDNSQVRNGEPTAQCIYGLPKTMAAANYAFFIALERAISLNHPKAAQVFVDSLLDIHRGQGLEVYWRENFTCPTESQFRAMSIQKVAAFLKLPVSLMQLFSDCNTDFTPLIKLLSLYFQIRNDYSNLCNQEYQETKGYCEDLTEGKFSFPIVHAIQSNADNGEVLNILRQKTTNVGVKKYCLNLMEKLGSLAYTRQVLTDLDKQMRQEIKRLGGNPQLVVALDGMLDWKTT